MTTPRSRADTDKINAKLDAIEAIAGEVGGLGISDSKRLIDALRIALEWFKSLTPLQRDNALREIAEALADARAGEQGGERVPHRVRRDPAKPICLCMILERTNEVVTVAISSMPYDGLKHIWLSKTVALKELPKGVSERHGPFFTVFEANNGAGDEVIEP
jgi:hypothetical protein